MPIDTDRMQAADGLDRVLSRVESRLERGAARLRRSAVARGAEAMKAYADLEDLPEDERIAIIARVAAEGQIVGFVVDDAPKADRYIRKLAAHPVRVIDRGPGPVKGTVLVRVGPKES